MRTFLLSASGRIGADLGVGLANEQRGWMKFLTAAANSTGVREASFCWDVASESFLDEGASDVEAGAAFFFGEDFGGIL